MFNLLLHVGETLRFIWCAAFNASDFRGRLCQMQSVTGIWAMEQFVWLEAQRLKKTAHFFQNEDKPQSSRLYFVERLYVLSVNNFNAPDFCGKWGGNTKMIPNLQN